MIRGAVIGGLVGIALAGCGGGAGRAHRATSTSTTAARVPVPPAARPRTPELSPALVGLQRALRSALRSAGPGNGVVVYDLTARRVLFSLRGGVERAPASVEKLYTSVAVLSELGPNAQLQTSVLGEGHLGPGGVWRGNLYLRGGGDPTLGDGGFNAVWEDGYGPTAAQLVAPLTRMGIRRVTGYVFGDDSLFDARRGGPSSGFAPDIPDMGGQLSALTYDHGSTRRRLSPAAFAARELVLTMRGDHIRARASALTAVTPPGAQPLASVSSPPMSVLLRLTDVPSDDFFAEMLTKQLGVRFGTGGTTSAGAAVITQALTRYGVAPTVVDGSGLSRADHTSPQQVVDLLRTVRGTPIGAELLAALPVVGVNGTVQRIGGHTPARGRCQAKTGTLNYVTNLAGYCNARGGHVLAFAVFIDGPSNLAATLMLSRMVGAIARY